MSSSSASAGARLRTRLIAAFLVGSMASLAMAGFALNRMGTISGPA